MSSVLILGNGSSRLRLESHILDWKGEIWVCNLGYTEAIKLPNVTRVYSVHPEVALAANDFKDSHNLDYSIVGPGFISFKENMGWSSGSQALLDALLGDYTEIEAAGFDFGGEDIYQTFLVEGSNFIKQVATLKDRFGPRFLDVHFLYPED